MIRVDEAQEHREPPAGLGHFETLRRRSRSRSPRRPPASRSPGAGPTLPRVARVWSGPAMTLLSAGGSGHHEEQVDQRRQSPAEQAASRRRPATDAADGQRDRRLLDPLLVPLVEPDTAAPARRAAAGCPTSGGRRRRASESRRRQRIARAIGPTSSRASNSGRARQLQGRRRPGTERPPAMAAASRRPGRRAGAAARRSRSPPGGRVRTSARLRSPNRRPCPRGRPRSASIGDRAAERPDPARSPASPAGRRQTSSGAGSRSLGVSIGRVVRRRRSTRRPGRR